MDNVFSRAPRSAPRGLTLIEMLIGMAITLVMMAAVVNLFATLGGGVRFRRASMEMNSNLRTARARLFRDLAGATCLAVPKSNFEDDNRADGYIEIIEGQWSDRNPSQLVTSGGTVNVDRIDPTTSQVPRDNGVIDYDGSGEVDGRDEREHFNRLQSLSPGGLGDYDDILCLTVRSESEPFQGRLPIWNAGLDDGQGNAGWWEMTTIESNLAEVIWYAVENPLDRSLGEPGMRTIYRRVLLIAPWVSSLPAYSGSANSKADVITDSDYFRLCDVSFRRQGTARIPNTLADLSKRENRFAHHH